MASPSAFGARAQGARLELATAHRARLVMPRLGQVIEPAHVDAVEPWWRAVGAPAPESVVVSR